MQTSWKDSIYLQREQLAGTLHQPLSALAERCAPVWGDRYGLNAVLSEGFADIPHCNFLYCMGTDGVQISDNIGASGVQAGYLGRDRSKRPYMCEPVPSWGFLLSDAYISLRQQRPSLTALQVVWGEAGALGYLGADFDLRDLPMTARLYGEPDHWRQVRGDPSIRRTVFLQSRVDSGLRDLNKIMAVHALDTLPSPEDIALAIGFLCSAEARTITGVLLPVDSGWHASVSYKTYAGGVPWKD